MLPTKAAKYYQEICDKEMPCGLKGYMKVGKAISISTAHWWLQAEGFKYTLHKKAIYYDGHNHEDVVKDHQERFLPAMEGY